MANDPSCIGVDMLLKIKRPELLFAGYVDIEVDMVPRVGDTISLPGRAEGTDSE